jgi:hypothetical protein
MHVLCDAVNIMGQALEIYTQAICSLANAFTDNQFLLAFSFRAHRFQFDPRLLWIEL